MSDFPPNSSPKKGFAEKRFPQDIIDALEDRKYTCKDGTPVEYPSEVWFEKLDLSGDTATDVSALGQCNTLKEIILAGCEYLETVSGLEDCESLEILDLRSCKQLVVISPLGNCRSLKVANESDFALLK